jgi:copper oxidase (laccase) domain-containing protein
MITINKFWPNAAVQGHFFGTDHPMANVKHGAKYYEQNAQLLAANNATVERLAQLYNRPFDSFKHCQLNFIDQVVVVEHAAQATSHIVADSMVTNNPEVSLLMLTADCAPLMLYDASTQTIGLVHISMRNLHLPIIEKTLAAMKAIHVQALIGPCIAQQNFEIGQEFAAQILQAYPFLKSCFGTHPSPEKTYLDLAQATQLILAQHSVAHVQHMGCDTYPQNNGYFSYRRNTHQGAQAPKNLWRNVSVIGLKF